MIWAVALGAGALVSAGVYLALLRDVLRSVIGLSLIGAGANLVLLGGGRVASAVPAIVPEGSQTISEAVANPLPQALVLTAIVIGFSLTCFSLAVALAVQQTMRVADSDLLSSAEPPPASDGYPPVLDEEH